MGGFGCREGEQPFFGVVELQPGGSVRGNDKLFMDLFLISILIEKV
jgi:hypothetical protein